MWFCFNLASDIVLPYFGRNSFWNLYQYFGRKFFCKFNLILLQLCILLFVWEEIYFIMFNNICEENSSESCTWYCYHYIPYFNFGKKFILKCVPIFGKKFVLKALLHIVTIKYPTLWFGKKFILKIVPICDENILLKGDLDIFTIVYHTFMFGKKFIQIYLYKLYQYLGRKFFWKLYLMLLPLYTLLYYFGRNSFRNLYQYLG